MVSYLYQAPTGIPGDITRADETSVEPAMLIAITDVYAQAFGIAMKYATGGISQIASGDAATVFAGVLAREVPSIPASSASDSLANAVPNPDQPQGFVVRGYINVKCWAGTPSRGGIVYMQSVTNGGVPVGAFRADGTDSGNAVALTLTQASWASDGVDADKNAELRVAR